MAPLPPPAAPGAKLQLWELSSLATARALVDKLLIHCLRDSGLRRFFAECSLPRLKRTQTERLLGALRSARDIEVALSGGTVDADAAVSLPVLGKLREANLDSMREHLVSALLELLAERGKALGRRQGEAVVALLLRTDPTLVLGLLPSEQSREGSRSPSPAKEPSATPPHRDVLGAKLAPLQVPTTRRMQALACATVSYLPFLVLALYVWCTIRIRRSWPLFLLYPLYAQLFGRDGTSVAPWPALRRNWLLRGCAAYFPAALFKADPTRTWDASRAYLIGYHPHGVCGCGAALAFGTDVLGWREKFSGLEVRLATVIMRVRLPLVWELLARMGWIPTDSASLARALQPGHAVAVNVGGREEFLDHLPGQCILTLRARRDFFRTALRSGAMLVPSFGFGENELFSRADEMPAPMRQLQGWLETRLGVSLPLFNGRSPLTYNLGPMPHRQRLTVVVGAPLQVERCDGEPLEAQVDALQKAYFAALRGLFERWRPQCEPESSTQLVII
uniref:diacylglycerol O-acyltransferase n=1 Tax=Alexandrium monilatum TaxID=311494 RepID=A0A7S4QTW8_9DINO|mmetsp:Transcript_8559/g.25974  ORF Transcript_8559/g.25974 Transcript_8559/m.25974 type:complete len:506 (+) Transcript_8559:42-1559(+)